MKNYAYITGLSQIFTDGDKQLSEYLTSVVWLNKTLKDTGAKYPLYCMVSNLPTGVTEYLESLGIGIIHKEKHAFTKPGGINKAWDSGLIKLCTFGLTQFDKVIWLDSDIEVLKNIDDLFEIETEKPIISTNMNYFSGERERISSGIFLCKPTENLVDSIIWFYTTYHFYADEDVLSHVPNEWVYYIGPEYNASPENDEVFEKKYHGRELKVFHWIGGEKPYSNNPTISEVEERLANPNCDSKIVNKLRLNTKYNINSYIEELKKSGKTCKFVKKLL